MNLFGSPNIEKMAAERDYNGLYECLEHRDKMVRLQAAQVLADMQDGAGWRVLMESVEQTSDLEVQATAAAMLGELGHPRAVPVLAQALKKARRGLVPFNEELINTLRQALENIGGAESEDALTSAGYRSSTAEGSVMGTLGGALGADEYLAGYTHPILPDTDAIQFLSAEEHLNIAVELREAEHAERGLVECSLALWLKPDWGYAWYLRGVLMEDLEREFEALLAYRRAVDLDHSLADAREALAELEKDVPFPLLDRNALLVDLAGSNWQERRRAAAGLGELAGSSAIDDEVVTQLIFHMDDEEREVRHAVVEALTEICAQTPELAHRALPALLNREESSWLLRFAVIEAVATFGDALSLSQVLHKEMDRLQERNPVFTSRKDPLLEVEYNRLVEIGVLAFERTGDLEGLLSIAEENDWVDGSDEETDVAWADELAEDEEEETEEAEYLTQPADLEGAEAGEQVSAEEEYEEGEEEAVDESELTDYVDEVSQMAAVALERVAKPVLPQVDTNTLVRLAQVPDLTLIDLTGDVETAEPVIVHDLSDLRSAARDELRRRGIQ